MTNRVLSGLAAIAGHAPRLAYTASDWVAAFSRPFRRPHVSREQIARLFPELSEAQLAKATRENWSNYLRNATLVESARRFGLTTIRRHVRQNPALAALRPPMILGTFHVGPLHALGAALEQVPGEILALRRDPPPWRVPRNATIAETYGTDEGRARVFHSSIAALRSGKFVVLALEAHLNETIELPLGERSAVLGRGAFALARITQVPIMPVVTRWYGTSVGVVCGDAIAAANDEITTATATARWFEQYLLENPGEITEAVLEVFR